MKVIALRSHKNNGKSNTLRLLYSLMLLDGFKQVPGEYVLFFHKPATTENPNPIPKLSYDLWAVLERNGKRVGLTTRGDKLKLLNEDLGNLKAKGCDVAICPTRIWRKKSIKDTYLDTEFKDKTTATHSSEMFAGNAMDAKNILDML